MGINLVVITENSKNLSLKGFRDALLQEPLIGKIAWDKHWEEFDWEGKNTSLGYWHHVFLRSIHIALNQKHPHILKLLF